MSKSKDFLAMRAILAKTIEPHIVEALRSTLEQGKGLTEEDKRGISAYLRDTLSLESSLGKVGFHRKPDSRDDIKSSLDHRGVFYETVYSHEAEEGIPPLELTLAKEMGMYHAAINSVPPEKGFEYRSRPSLTFKGLVRVVCQYMDMAQTRNLPGNLPIQASSIVV